MRIAKNTFKMQGFTLVELMVTLVIGTILVMLAAPSFKKSISTNLVTTQANSLMSSINLARSEAVKRQSNVTICASTNQTTCGGSDWSTGWIVRLDSNNSPIRSQGAFKGTTVFTYNPATITTVQFNSQGLASINPKFTLTPGECAAGYRGIYDITIAPTGRAGVANSATLCS